MSETSKDHVMNSISDLVSNFLYYDRKEDEDLPLGTIQELVETGELTAEEMIEEFAKELRDGLTKKVT